MDKRVFLGIDLGTTGIKLILMRDDGTVIDKNYADYPILSPNLPMPNRTRPTGNSLCRLSRELLARNSEVLPSLTGIGITGQMHTQVYLDAQGKPLGNAITWMDQRCQPLVDELNRHHRSEIFRHTANYLTTTYTAPHIWGKRGGRNSRQTPGARQDYLVQAAKSDHRFLRCQGTLLFHGGSGQATCSLFGIEQPMLTRKIGVVIGT